MEQLLAFSTPFCAEKPKPENRNYAETFRLCSFCQQVPPHNPLSAYIIENDKDGIPIIWKQMVLAVLNIYNNQNRFFPPLHSPEGRQGVKTFILINCMGI